MNRLITKAYLLGIGQLASLLVGTYMLYQHYSAFHTLLKAPRTHLLLQIIMSFTILYVSYHFAKVIKRSSQMRKAAQEQKEANSRWVEALLFVLVASIIFWALYYTSPFRRYYPNQIEHAVYLINGLLQMILLVSVVSLQHHTTKKFLKKKQRYAVLGGAAGLGLFIIYYQILS